MRIRQIELVGFKSFREPTRIVLSSGLNAIVGPNGCGKSNVSDAIRWALGEQSVKHLRARDMEDVIFSGNASSPPLNFAEVSLTFEQGEGGALDLAGEAEGLAAHVARQHEFTVTRRIFRSGDSQYFLNQTQARLRDITELFLGSGVGPKAYAMIEQGRVGQIVKAKPEELRLFVEEAAGTTRFRSRKLAAERKLERTGENLARVQDVMREIERQLASLRRQAIRAEEYRRLQAELETTEIALAGSRWHALCQEREGIAQELSEARRVVEAFREEMDGALRDRESAARDEQRASAAIEGAFAAVAEIGAAVVRATERQGSAQESIASLGARIERSRAEAQSLDGQLEEARRAMREAEGQRASWVEREALESKALEAAQGAVEGLVPVFEEAQRVHAGSVAIWNEARLRVATASSSRAEATARLEGLRGERERIAIRLADREGDLGASRGRSAQAVAAQRTAQSNHGRLAESRQLAASDLRAREEEQRRLEEGLASIREALLHVRGRLEGLQERERSLDGYADGLAAAMQGTPAPRGLVVDGLLIPADLEQAVAAVLGDVLRGAVVDDLADAAEIAEHLRRDEAGRVALVPLAGSVGGTPTELPSGTAALAPQIGVTAGRESIRATLFGSVAVAADLATAIAAWRSHGGSFTWVTRAGEMVDRQGVVTGGVAPVSAGLLQRRRELGELAAQIAEDELRQAAVESRLGEVRQECTLLGEDLRRLDAEAHAAALDLVAADHAVETARREIDAAEQRLAEAREEEGASDRAMALAGQAVEVAAEELRGAERGALDAERRAEAASADLLARRAAQEAGVARRDACREALSTARESLATAVAERSRWEREWQAIARRGEDVRREIDAMGSEREATVRALSALEVELESAKRELAEREAEVERARENAKRLQIELREHDGRVARARKSLDEARERCTAQEIRLAERSAQIDALATYAHEQHGIDVATAEIPAGFDGAAAAHRISEIKERIVRLGDVNVAAIADARELEERLGFLDGQRRDLEASMEDLRRTIAELSRTSRARFRETFEQANVKFQEFFAELFRGGSAGLKLTNPQSLLDSGVEMEVQPPGKSVRALEALSGGEQALTAISLLMALFSLRATPFCVLDEVDAPLDEANLGRFNSMLRRMSERTQFVVITHKQLTMETASALYGVTMAEAGVSQLVSVAMPSREASQDDAGELELAASA